MSKFCHTCLVCKLKVEFGKISLRNMEMAMEGPRESSALQHQVILSIHETRTNEWDANTTVRWSQAAHGRLLHRFFRILPGTLGLWWERICFWEDLWWGIKWVLNFQDCSKQLQLKTFLFHHSQVYLSLLLEL